MTTWTQALVDRPTLLSLLDNWCARGWLRQLDRALALFLAERDEQAPALLILAAALASHQLGQGHVCLDLEATLANPDFTLSLPPEGEEAEQAALLPSQVMAGLSLNAWLASLADSPLLTADNAPLKLAGNCLYLRRYWDYEQQVARHINQRLQAPASVPDDLAAQLNKLFAQALVVDGQRQVDWQKLACALAARGRFTLITGGPGTGKTTTVVRLLALLQESAMSAGKPLRLSLAAPTGKAAARLTESIGAQVASLPVSEAVREHIPSSVTTLHRLLGSLPNTRHFRHNASNPLPLDVLVVDEASMIDLEMMALLLQALPQHARLILLGDKDQLASVEAGAVLGDLCRDAEQGGYSQATCDWLIKHTAEPLADSALAIGEQALAQHIVMLRYSRRFGAHSGIGRLATAVNQGDAQAARSILAAGSDDLYVQRLRDEQDRNFENLVIKGRAYGQQWSQGYAHYLEVMRDTRPAAGVDEQQWQAWANRVLQAFEQFQLLSAVRKGHWGVEALNERIAQALQRRGLLEQSSQLWYEGRPVLVTRNDYSLGLMNGDIGIALRMPELGTDGQRFALRVAFARNDGTGELRYVLPSRLSSVESVYAMTVHKSQGSEFAHCALILPDSLNPVLTRELVYTGITRARHSFSLIESRGGILEQAIARRVQRRSGLREAL